MIRQSEPYQYSRANTKGNDILLQCLHTSLDLDCLSTVLPVVDSSPVVHS